MSESTKLTSMLKKANGDLSLCFDKPKDPEDKCKPRSLCANVITFRRKNDDNDGHKKTQSFIGLDFVDAPAKINLPCDENGRLIITGCERNSCIKSCSGCDVYSKSANQFVFNLKTREFETPRIRIAGTTKCEPAIDFSSIDRVVFTFKYPSLPAQQADSFFIWQLVNPHTGSQENLFEVRREGDINYFDFINGVLGAHGIILHTPSTDTTINNGITTLIKGNAETDGTLNLYAQAINPQGGYVLYEFVLNEVPTQDV